MVQLGANRYLAGPDRGRGVSVDAAGRERPLVRPLRGVHPTTTVIDDQDLGRSVAGGLRDLIVLNTTGSQFWGFPRDE